MELSRRKVGIAGVTVLVLVGGLLGTAAASQTDEVISGVEVAGIDVSELTQGQLQPALRPAARAIEARALTLLAGGHSWIRTPAEMGIGVDLERTATEALKAGRGNPVQWLRHSFLGGHSRITWITRVDQRLFTSALERLGREVNREAVSGEITLRGAEVVVVPPEPGITLKRAEVRSVLAGAVTNPPANGRLILPAKISQPAIGADQLEAVKSQAESILVAPVEFVLDNRSFALGPEQIAATLRTKVVTSPGRENLGRLILSIDREALAGQMSAAAPWGFRLPRDASFIVEKTKVRLVPGEDGLGVDTEAAAAGVEALSWPGPRAPINLTPRTSPPALTTEAAGALGIVERVSTFTTIFDPNLAPRVNNIDLIAKAMDAKIVRPGEEFSLNGATGERTPEKGYQVAQVIVDGELVPGLGGGVCQAGTATFNAVLLAGLEVRERHNHSLYISRYPVGRDATLYYGQYDLRFRNDTPYGLLLKAAVNYKFLNVSIYSTPNNRTVEFQTSPQRNLRPPSTRYVDDSSLPLGQEVVVEPGKPGFDVTVTRTVREGDKVIRTDTFVSRYRPWKRIVRRGTGPPAPAKPTPAPTPTTTATSTQ